MTATNVCSNFGGFRCSPALKASTNTSDGGTHNTSLLLRLASLILACDLVKQL